MESKKYSISREENCFGRCNASVEWILKTAEGRIIGRYKTRKEAKEWLAIYEA